MADMTERERPRVVVLLGPTGVGKSKLAIELAEEFWGEIINADSMQVYKYMDIGTAKPTIDERRRIPHHLLDVVTPDQPFHAALYRALGRKAIGELHQSGKYIWVVGGTGLYIKALIQGLFTSPRIDPRVKEKLKHEAKEKGEAFLYQRLCEVDPGAASRIHPHDLYRIIRALEVFDSTGLPISFFREQHRFGEKPFVALKIGLDLNRERLYRWIDQRVDEMIEKGLLKEVKRLIDMGYGPELKPMGSLGYKHMIQYLAKKIEWDEAIRQMKRDTRNYAKRQWTWFRRDREVRWYDRTADRKAISAEVRSFLGAV
jgi:tRNA dimethylallyltransferase